METKFWLQSKTIIFNLVTVCAGIVAAASVFGVTPDVVVVSEVSNVAERLAPVLIMISPFVNLILRFSTDRAITVSK